MVTGRSPLPLGFSPLVRTQSVEAAENVVSSALLESRILNVEDTQQFGMTMNATNLGSAELTCVSYDCGFDIACDTAQDCVILFFAEGSPASTTVNRKSVDIISDISVIDHDARVTHVRTGAAQEYILKVTMHEVEQRLQAVLDRTVSGRPIFENRVPGDDKTGGAVRGTLRHVVNCLDVNPGILQLPLLKTKFEELLFGLILSLPNNYSEELNSDGRSPAAPASVRRAEEFMEANTGSPITISDILSQTGCSKKALFDNFRKFRGYTPNEFLINARLRLAHSRLIEASPQDTVTSIAFNSGFSHMGRFSRTYQSRYGVTPSVTLRRGPGKP